MAVIETERLRKYYGKARGIEDVTLTVEEGEIFGFIGPNGAGKSTTIRTLLNYIFPTGGTARVFGLDIVEDSAQIRAQVGYLPGEVGYYDDMSVEALMQYAAGFYQGGYSEHRPRIDELLDIFELDRRRKIHALSQGNKKKVGIVQALLHRPRLLILDEPTSGLDPLMQTRLFEVLAGEHKRGATIFFSSHVLSEVQKFCHRVAIIKEGRILRVEEVEKLRHGLFQKVRVVFRQAGGDEGAGGGEAGVAAQAQALDLPGVVHRAVDGRTVELLFSGDVNELVRRLARHDLESLWLEEPPLEEVFLHYYEKEGR
ncbi:MAG: ABC transporter ATP-binding protein [Bacillota bacterium]|nr:MAG: ABC transporter ATP-binding protein [Bacillota bacterium]